MTLKFQKLDPHEKLLVWDLAAEAETITPYILQSAANVGELWESAAFFRHYPKGTAEHERLVEHLRLGNAANETILDVIRCAAPNYVTLAQQANEEMDELLANLENVPAGL